MTSSGEGSSRIRRPDCQTDQTVRFLRFEAAVHNLCCDATGVLVQAPEKCKHGHFWVVAAPERHVLFAYSEKHNGAAVDELLAGYRGVLVADAHAVYDHLFKSGLVIEAGCWAHARRYWWKALETDPDRAKQALAFIGGLFDHRRRALV
jgi:transposase